MVIDSVSALKAFWNEVPPELVTVTVLMPVPTAPVTDAAPVVFNVRALPAVPVTAPRVIEFAIPVPTVKLALELNNTLPKEMAPVDDPPTTLLPGRFKPVLPSPKVIIPVPSAANDPVKLMEDGLVAMMPPVKLKLSVPALPKATVPALAKVVAPAIVLTAPSI